MAKKKEQLEYVIGLDGGGTKTVATSYDLNTGRELKTFKGNHGNISVNQSLAYNNISHTLKKVKVTGGKLVSISLGIAGIVTEARRAILKNKLVKDFKTKINLWKDVEYAAFSNFHNEDGVIVISGTGSVVLVKKDNKIKIYGGWGHVLGDEGSAYKISIDFLRSAIINYELGKTYTANEKAVLKKFKIDTANEFITLSFTQSKSEIAEIAGVLKTVGDKEYQNILRRNANDLFQTLNRSICAQKLKNKTIPIVFHGSVFDNNKFYREEFIKNLNENKIDYEIVDEVDLNRVAIFFEKEFKK